VINAREEIRTATQLELSQLFVPPAGGITVFEVRVVSLA
jgi:hypothetical protein